MTFGFSPFAELDCPPNFVLFENHSVFSTKKLNLFFKKWKPLSVGEIQHAWI